MNKFVKIAIVAALTIAVGVVIASKRYEVDPAENTSQQRSGATQPDSEPAGPLPRLAEFGGSQCLNCKLMKPVLKQIKAEYAGKLEVEIIDVVEDKLLALQHKIRFIPTQIFFDASGKELYRHEGLFSKDKILATWKNLGVELGSPRPIAEGD